MANAENLKMIRFMTGEEIMGEVTEENNEVLKVKNPIRVIVMPNKADPKTPSVGFGPYAEFSEDKDFTFNRNHVIVTYTPVTEFVNQYNAIFGGIVVPNSKLITP
mgnify:CR=1 FL=1